MAGVAAASSSSAPAPVQQTTPLFPSENVEYIHLVDSSGHLFVFDKEACQRSSGTLRVMIEAGDAVNGVQAVDDDAPAKVMSITLEDAPTRALDGVLSFLMWRKRWINVVVEKIQDWPIPRENQALIQEMAKLSHFMEV